MQRNIPEWALSVGDLIEQLQQLDPSLPVATSSDAEGNRLSFVTDISVNPTSIEATEHTPTYTSYELYSYAEEDVGELREEGVELQEVLFIWPV